MIFWLGVIVFAVGILVSVCLHEAGHLVSAKQFGMKATQYFAGFGPTLWSFRRGETEYGVKAIPAGGFVKIVGMTPLEDVDPADEPRAFWRKPTWQRTIVLSAGSLTHFLLAFVLLYIGAVWLGLPNPARATYDPSNQPAYVGATAACVVPDDAQGNIRACTASDPVGPAKAAGLKDGDRITAIGGMPVATYDDLVATVRKTPAGKPVEVTYIRDGQQATTAVTLVSTQRVIGSTLTTVSAIGVTPAFPEAILHYGPVSGIRGAASFTGTLFEETFKAIGRFPSKIPKLFDALQGQQRDQDTPISVVGASRIGGEFFQINEPVGFIALLAGLNIFIGVFNLFPLLPLDGGHIAIIWYERVRSWLASLRGRPDPGRVDYNKLLPVTYVVMLVFAGLTLLTLAADIINPIRLTG
jgi:membrane-associated protease RseP (regulator of RpoE activity)